LLGESPYPSRPVENVRLYEGAVNGRGVGYSVCREPWEEGMSQGALERAGAHLR
jgi:hypothetical protein